MNVWLVWDGEWEAVLTSIHTTQAGAERAAFELRKDYHFDKRHKVTVEEREVSQ